MCEHEGDPSEALDAEGLLDGDEVEVHHDEGVLLVDALLDLAQRVQRDAVLEALEAHAGGGADGDAEGVEEVWE